MFSYTANVRTLLIYNLTNYLKSESDLGYLISLNWSNIFMDPTPLDQLWRLEPFWGGLRGEWDMTSGNSESRQLFQEVWF